MQRKVAGLNSSPKNTNDLRASGAKKLSAWLGERHLVCRRIDSQHSLNCPFAHFCLCLNLLQHALFLFWTRFYIWNDQQLGRERSVDHCMHIFCWIEIYNCVRFFRARDGGDVDDVSAQIHHTFFRIHYIHGQNRVSRKKDFLNFRNLYLICEEI